MKVKLLVLALTVLLSASNSYAQHPIDVERFNAQGEHYRAMLAYESLPKRIATVSARIAAAQSAWALGLVDKAIEEFDAVLRTELDDPTRARTLLSRGIIEFQESRFQVSILYAEKMVALLKDESPLKSKGWLLWAESLAKLNSWGDAEGKYIAALDSATLNEKPELYYLLGLCQIRLGKTEDARKHFENVPLQHERVPATIRQLAWIALEKKEYDESTIWLQKGRTEYPQNFLDSWVDYALLRSSIAKRDSATVKAIQSEAQNKYPPSDTWLNLINAAAETFFWEQNHNGE